MAQRGEFADGRVAILEPIEDFGVAEQGDRHGVRALARETSEQEVQAEVYEPDGSEAAGRHFLGRRIGRDRGLAVAL
jgi:hypothetical protein